MTTRKATKRRKPKVEEAAEAAVNIENVTLEAGSLTEFVAENQKEAARVAEGPSEVSLSGQPLNINKIPPSKPMRDEELATAVGVAQLAKAVLKPKSKKQDAHRVQEKKQLQEMVRRYYDLTQEDIAGIADIENVNLTGEELLVLVRDLQEKRSRTHRSRVVQKFLINARLRHKGPVDDG